MRGKRLNLIIGKKTSQFKASCKDSKKLQESWTYEMQKSFQGLAIYGHEVSMSLQTRAKLFGTHFSNEVAVKSCFVFVKKP
jgi:hypothetical protein